MKITNKNIKSIIKSHINEYGSSVNLNHLDVSNVTDMNGLFASCTKFNGDISKWDVSRVTNMRDMFAYSKFNDDIISWNVNDDIEIDYMFKYHNFKYANIDILKEYFNDSIPKGKII